MLLICPRCQSTYTIDDQMYAQQGAACQNCMEPLVPSQNGYGNNAQWGSQPQYGNDAQWGQPQYGNDAQWGSQPQYGNDAQWGSQPQWGNQPQWENQPQYGGAAEQAQMKTVGLDLDEVDKFAGGEAASAPKYEGNERTVALDLDDIQSETDMSDWGNGNSHADEGVATMALDAPNFSNMPHGPNVSGVPAPPTAGTSSAQIVVGNAMPGQGNNQLTHLIDIGDIDDIYGSNSLNPFIMFYRSLPKMAFIISGALLGLALLGLIISLIVASQPEKVEHDINAAGDIVVKGTPEKPLTFKEIAAKTKINIPDAIPLESFDDAQEGILIGVSESTGILYNNQKVMSLDEFTSTDAFNDKLFQYASADHDTPVQIPIILFIDGSLTMNVVYRLMYTLGPTRRPIYIGGSTSTGISTFTISPFEWPEHENHLYSMESPSNTQLKITNSDLTLRRLSKKATETMEPLMDNTDGEKIYELRDEFLGGKIIYTNIRPALGHLRSKHQRSIQIKTDGNVKLSQFMKIILFVQGNPDNPNVEQFLLETVPLH